MGKDSKIEWTDHTFNPWWGCVKISPACRNCYAETWAKRTGHQLWGAAAPRRYFGESHWNEPVIWNRVAEERGQRKKVFCSSMADVFESNPTLDQTREKLWDLIDRTTCLDWLLLTKRPENIQTLCRWGKSQVWPANVWLGATVESQEWAEQRLPHLLQHQSAIRFLSCEPLIGALDLSHWMGKGLRPIDWIIVGGESGPHSRPLDPAWAVGLRDFCQARRIPFLFKQWGHWAPEETPHNLVRRPKTASIRNGTQVTKMIALGKSRAGKLLDGLQHDGVPVR